MPLMSLRSNDWINLVSGIAVLVILTIFIAWYLYNVAPYNQPIAQQIIPPKGVAESVLISIIGVAFIIAVFYTKGTRQVSYY